VGPDLAKEADAQRRRPPTFVAASSGFGNAEFENDMRIYTSSSNDNEKQQQRQQRKQKRKQKQ